MNKFKYSIENDFEDSFNIETSWQLADDIKYIEDFEFDTVIEECADDFYNNHDGYECYWPLTFTLFTIDGKLLITKKVEMETQPSFYVGD